MNRIRVLAPGLLTTVQDLGRFGWAHYGVSASGAADAVALRAGNLLVGNAENAAGLEMTLAGGELEFESAAIVALTGSDFGADLPMWMAVEIAAGRRVRFGQSRGGARAYLAVRGGLATPKVMGSASVHLATGVGGRPLRAGDMLGIGEEVVCKAQVGWQAKLRNGLPAVAPAPVGALRVTAGPQAERFGGELYASRYIVTEESNRMGLRLRGPANPSPPGGMLTEGTALGAVQVPPDGQPIILFVEHQTTGGYPKPANVISADFWRLGQLRPREEVRFELVEMGRAIELLREQERWIYGLMR